MKFSRVAAACLFLVTAALAVSQRHNRVEAAPATPCRVLVTSANSAFVAVIDPNTDGVSVFPANGVGGGGPSQSAVAYDRLGTKFYVAGQDNVIRVFDSVNYGLMTSITQSAFAMTTSPIRDEIYAVDYTNDRLVKIDSSTDAVVSWVQTGVDPADVIVSPDGAYVYVANSNAVPGSITRADSLTLAAITTPVENGALGQTNPNGLSISPDGSQLFIAGTGRNRLLKVPTADIGVGPLNLSSALNLGGQNYQTAATSDASRIFVASSLDNAIHVVNGSTMQLMTSVTVGAFPLDLAITPDDQFLYVANFFGNSVSKIRLSDYQVTNIALGSSPSSLTIGGPGCWQRTQPQPQPNPVVNNTGAPTPQLWRATLDPAGGTCVDETPRTEAWTANYLGYRYLPGPTDCTRRGYVFTGWANTTTPTVARTFPLLDDPSSNTQRYFVAENATLTAIWKPLPTAVSELVVFANFLCGPCTNAWLIHWPSEHATSYDYSLNPAPATCAPKVTVFGFHACQLTGLTSGTPLTATVTPRNTDGVGPSTTTTFTLRTRR